MSTLLLIPLDDRPATSEFPRQIGAIARVNVEIPPLAMLGNLQREANPEALLAWLESHAPQAQGLIVALDTLGYGGLIPSRQSLTPLAEIQRRLAGLRELKQAKPELPIYAFSVTMRLSAAAALEEEKPYWAQFGSLIFQHSYHEDKYEQTGDEADLVRSRTAQAQVPGEILADYLETRARNFEINRMAINWTQQGLFDLLLLTLDDTGQYGFNVREQRALRQQILETGLQDRVLVYPGADEVASVLVGRHINRSKGQTPRFYPTYSTPRGGQIVPLYEDRPLEQNVRAQIQAVGGKLADSPEEAQIRLLINTPATGQGDLALRTNLERVDEPPRNLMPFIRILQESPLPTALADVAYANGSDPELFRHFRDYSRLAAFAAWNTAGNTLGSVVAMASAWLDEGSRDLGAHRQLLLDRMADDILYQSQLRPRMQEELRAGATIPALEKELPGRLQELWGQAFASHPLTSIQARFPWQRLFEIGVHVQEHPQEAGA